VNSCQKLTKFCNSLVDASHPYSFYIVMPISQCQLFTFCSWASINFCFRSRAVRSSCSLFISSSALRKRWSNCSISLEFSSTARELRELSELCTDRAGECWEWRLISDSRREFPPPWDGESWPKRRSSARFNFTCRDSMARRSSIISSSYWEN